MRIRPGAVAIAGAGAYALALSTSERLFAAHRALLMRAYGALGQFCSATEAPVAEALALSLAIGSVCVVLGALILCVHRRSYAPLRRSMAGLLALMIGLGGALALMWPAWLDDSPRAQAAYSRAYSLDELEQLILTLDGILREAEDEVDLSGPVMRLSASLDDIAARAAQAYRAAGYQANAPKLSRFPCWMTRLRIAGIFVPLTGEAVVSPDDFDSALPFTMLHELAHAQGILREDEANLLALEVALSSGDAELIWSGALTALRYALNTLRALDGTRYQALRDEISPPALRELDAQCAFDYAPRGYDVPLGAAGSGKALPVLARSEDAFVRVAGYGAYDGLTYLLMDAGWFAH